MSMSVPVSNETCSVIVPSLPEIACVDHALGAVHLRVDGRGDRLLDGDRVGAGVHGGRLDLGRRDLGELCDGQAEHHHGAAAAGADVSGLGRTTIPSLTFWRPSVTTRSPGLSPSVMTQSPSTCSPAFTVRSATLSSGPTTATWYAPWISCTACAGTRRAPRTVSAGARTLAYRPGRRMASGFGKSAWTRIVPVCWSTCRFVTYSRPGRGYVLPSARMSR